MKLIVVLIILLATCSWTQSYENADKDIAPLSNYNIFTSRGLQAGMGVGPILKSGCNTITSWEGSLGYSYMPSWKGDLNFLTYGGEVDGETTVSMVKYFTSLNYLTKLKKVRLALGPSIGAEVGSLGELRGDASYWGWRMDVGGGSNSYCGEVYSGGGVDVAWEINGSYPLNGLWWLLASEATHVYIKGRLEFSYSLGVALDLRKILFKWVGNESNAFYVFLTSVKYLIYVYNQEIHPITFVCV